jgi:hypothetical protein
MTHMTFDDVDEFATNLPAVTVGARWANRTWFVGDKGFAWQRPLNKADLKRFGDEPAPTGEILAVIVENLDAKDALLSMALPGFFTIEHFKNYPALLIALKQARSKDVRAAIVDAHRLATSRVRPKRAAAAKPRVPRRAAAARTRTTKKR